MLISARIYFERRRKATNNGRFEYLEQNAKSPKRDSYIIPLEMMQATRQKEVYRFTSWHKYQRVYYIGF